MLALFSEVAVARYHRSEFRCKPMDSVDTLLKNVDSLDCFEVSIRVGHTSHSG